MLYNLEEKLYNLLLFNANRASLDWSNSEEAKQLVGFYSLELDFS